MQNDNLNDSLIKALAKVTKDAGFETVYTHTLSDNPDPTMYTIENKETGKGIRVLMCGCEFSLDVDYLTWLDEHKAEHLARHGIAFLTVELTQKDTDEE